MEAFRMPVSLRWADFDINGHLRHSVYYDYGAAARVEFLDSHGLTLAAMLESQIGPVLFREEALFRREVRWGDELYITLSLSKMRRDFSRFSFRHELYKQDDQLAAVINVDGAWIDMQRRKLTVPPKMVTNLSVDVPKTDDFEWLD